MTDAELIARLRGACYLAFDDWCLSTAPEAADRIEALTKEREQWRRAAETRAEGWKISDDARIEAEIKLAKAAEVLEQCEIMLRLRGHDEVAAIARTTLAEIKGESQDGMV